MKHMTDAMAISVFYDEELRRVAAMMPPGLLSCVQLACEAKSHPSATPEAVVEVFGILWVALMKVCCGYCITSQYYLVRIIMYDCLPSSEVFFHFFL